MVRCRLKICPFNDKNKDICLRRIVSLNCGGMCSYAYRDNGAPRRFFSADAAAYKGECEILEGDFRPTNLNPSEEQKVSEENQLEGNN